MPKPLRIRAISSPASQHPSRVRTAMRAARSPMTDRTSPTTHQPRTMPSSRVSSRARTLTRGRLHSSRTRMPDRIPIRDRTPRIRTRVRIRSRVRTSSRIRMASRRIRTREVLSRIRRPAIRDNSRIRILKVRMTTTKPEIT